ncbi:MAG TPA: hypothetical protein DCG79_03010, partial [Clostridiales bacterium]|nr:hypothetical protein [Clostridiales bacterium]
MVFIKEVVTAKERRAFVNFPLKLYRDNAHYAPLFYGDEKALLSESTNIYSDYTKSKFFLAYDGRGKVVGRVGAIVNYADNKKTGVKSVRFTRLDAVDDKEVFAALMNAVESFASSEGIKVVHGPLGYNDMDKEGLLIQGFEYDETYGGVYNYPYYLPRLEELGYQKEFDWIERKIFVGDKVDERYQRMSEVVKTRYRLKELIANEMKASYVIDTYADAIFKVVDEAYRKLHGTVPFTEKAKQALVSGLRIIVKPRYLSVIADESGKIVGFGLILPAIWHALHKSRGKLFPFGFLYFLPLLFKKPKEAEMALIGVVDEYRNTGAHTLIIKRLWENVIADGITELESNANLEDNVEIN